MSQSTGSVPEGGFSCVGASPSSPGTAEKLMGSLRYADDLTFPSVLFGGIVWPQCDHARLIAVDVSQARQLDGVVAVLTARDIPGVNAFGPVVADQPVFAHDTIRYRGDPVALVIAATHDVAEAAARLVRVECTPLRPVYRPEEALADGAPRLFPTGNLALEYSLRCGDVSQGKREAAVVVEGQFSVPAVAPGAIEPESAIAEWTDGRLTLISACQNPEAIRPQLASVLGVTESQVHLVEPPVGGAFGGKLGISIQALVAVAAYVTGRPVKITLTREESVALTNKRHPMSMTYRMGFDAEAHLRFLEAEILANCGAYQTLSPVLIPHTVNCSTGPYRIPHVRVTGRGAFTNTAPSGAMRGFGLPQPTFAVESLMDMAARRFGISPLEMRRRNALRPGDRAPLGEIMTQDCYLVETIDALEPKYEKAVAETRGRDGFGVGFACGWKNYGEGLGHRDFAEAEVEVFSDGHVDVRVGSVDIGQGVAAVLAQVAAERLRVPYESVHVRLGDTDLGLLAKSTAGSRQTAMSGNAILKAIEALDEEVCRTLPGITRTGKEPSPDLVRNARMLAARGSRAIARGVFEAPRSYPACSTAGSHIYFGYAFFSNLVVIQANRATGEVQVRALHSCFDVGRAINRRFIEGQIEGGEMMSLGYALSEAYYCDETRRSVGLHDCGLLHIGSLPQQTSLQLIECGDSLGPYGAKGIGEAPAVPAAPAVTNAIYDALGVRILSLPASPCRVKEELGRLHENTSPSAPSKPRGVR